MRQQQVTSLSIGSAVWVPGPMDPAWPLRVHAGAAWMRCDQVSFVRVDADGRRGQRLGVIRLHHHPFSRASTVLWMLEEVAVDYELVFVDIMAGEQKSDAFIAKNPMGKLPTLEDGDLVVTEAAAIGLYLADRYGGGALAPAVDSPERGTYYRWSLFAPSVIEPGATAKSSGWEYREGTVGWGNFDAMVAAMEAAVRDGDFLLGDQFSMADAIFGGTLRFMLKFEMVEPRAAFTSYVKRLEQRPALQRADAKNAAVVAERGLGR